MDNFIFEPKLPVKPGYIEVEINGERVYEKIQNPIDSLERELVLLKAQLQVTTDRADFMEDCVAEMATAVYTV